MTRIRYLIERKKLDIEWCKVKGHSRNRYNNLAGNLAKDAIIWNKEEDSLTRIDQFNIRNPG